jgi:hypothetical protein
MSARSSHLSVNTTKPKRTEPFNEELSPNPGGIRVPLRNLIRGECLPWCPNCSDGRPLLPGWRSALVDDPVGYYGGEMNTQFVSRVAVLATVAILLAGCTSTATGNNSSPGKSLQLRVVTSSIEGPCTLPAISSDTPASACNMAGTTTYRLGKSLGTITPISVTLAKDQGSAHSVSLELNKADTSTLGTVSGEAIDKNLAIVLDGQVLSAPLVKSPITTSPLTLAFATASEAKQTTADITTSATP